MIPRSVEDLPPLITDLAINAYVNFIEHAGERGRDSENADGGVYLVDGLEVPQSVGEALAPLELLYGKTFHSAVAIVLHGAEPVVRFVEGSDRGEETSEGSTTDTEGSTTAERCIDENAEPHYSASDEQQGRPCRSHFPLTEEQLNQRRCIYQVGEHTLFSSYYCPCSAYAYQSIHREEVWCCKHLLALKLALRLEEAGIGQDTLRVKVVGTAEFENILLGAI